MAKGGCSCAAIEETQYLIKNPWAQVQEEKKQAVQFPEHTNGKAEMERHPAMLRGIQTDSCLHCRNGTAQNPRTRWRRKDTGVHPPGRVRQLASEPMPHPPRTPPVPPGDSEGADASEIEDVPPRYVYIHTPLPNIQFFNLNAFAKDRKRDKHFNPDLLTDKGTSTD